MSCFQALKEKGYRLTPQRFMVLQAIDEAESHISAEEIYAKVRAKYPEFNISTVYRTLELLKKLELVSETDLGEGIRRYHHTDEGHHHHLICRQCGKIIDLDESSLEPLKDMLIREYGFLPELRHTAIFGRCLSCQK